MLTLSPELDAPRYDCLQNDHIAHTIGRKDKIRIVNRKSSIEARQADAGFIERQRSRERYKLVGLIAIVMFILIVAFIRFGKTIPWGAR